MQREGEVIHVIAARPKDLSGLLRGVEGATVPQTAARSPAARHREQV
jgi:hypothetical protein